MNTLSVTMTKGAATKGLVLLGIVFIITFAVFQDKAVSAPDTMIGIQYNQTTEIFYLWNTMNNYYIDGASGLQITNHFDEYWSHHTVCFRYTTDKNVVKEMCADALDWTWDYSSDNETYTNLTGISSFSDGAYKTDVELVYHLNALEDRMFVYPTFIIDGKATSNIQLIVMIRDIQIGATTDRNYMLFYPTNDTTWMPINGAVDLSYTDSQLDDLTFDLVHEALVQPVHGKRMTYWWDDNMTLNGVDAYMSSNLSIKDGSGVNAEVNLTLNLGDGVKGDELSTMLAWRDPDPPTDCSRCLWISSANDFIYRVSMDAPGVSLENWDTQYASPFGVDYRNGSVYMSDYGENDVFNFTLAGVEENEFATAYSGDALGLCSNKTHLFLIDSRDDTVYINAWSDPATNVDSWTIPADSEGCWVDEDSLYGTQDIYILQTSADIVYIYDMGSQTEISNHELAIQMDNPTGIANNGTHFLIAGGTDDLIYVLTPQDLIDVAYSSSFTPPSVDPEGLSYYFVDRPPKWNAPAINASTVFIGMDINHTTTWTDGSGLGGWIFEWNATGVNCDAGLENVSFPLWVGSPTSSKSHNTSTIPATCAGKTIGWRFYANDTFPQWNKTDLQTYEVYKYGTMNVSWLYGATSGINDTSCTSGSLCNYYQNDSFTANATVTCDGGVGATCGDVSMAIRMNLTSQSEPDYLMNDTTGQEPLNLLGGGGSSDTLAYWRPVGWDINEGICAGNINNPEYAVDYRYNDTTTKCFMDSCSDNDLVLNYTFDLPDGIDEGNLSVTGYYGGADVVDQAVYNWTDDTFFECFTFVGAIPTQYFCDLTKDNGLINSTGGVILYFWTTSTTSRDNHISDTYITTTGNTYDYWGITTANDQDLMNASYGSDSTCDDRWCVSESPNVYDNTNYDAIEQSDNSRSDLGDASGFITTYDIKTNETVGDISSIVLRYEGTAINAGSDETPNPHIWNDTRWSSLTFDSIDFEGNDDLLYEEFNTSISNYIDVDGYIHISFNGSSIGNYELDTDYIKVNIITGSSSVSNPTSLGSMSYGDRHQLNFTVNASSSTNPDNYLIDFNTTSSFTSVLTNSTPNAYICIGTSCFGEGPADSCTYVSGDWHIDCSDWCQITTVTDLSTDKLICVGSGEVYINAEVTYGSFVIGDGCKVVLGASGKMVKK